MDHGKDRDEIVIKGSNDEINTRNEIAQGGESRKIDLRGSGRRSLRRVEF